MSLADVGQYLAYEPDTGMIHWKGKPKGRGYPFKIGDVAGCVRADGRRVVCFRGVLYLASRLAWLLHYGIEVGPDVEVEHKSGDPSDDRICNLRLANRQQNALNGRSHADSRSRFKGAHRPLGRRRWISSFRGKHLGCFDTEIEAARAYDQAAKAFSPEFCRLNFPEEV